MQFRGVGGNSAELQNTNIMKITNTLIRAENEVNKVINELVPLLGANLAAFSGKAWKADGSMTQALRKHLIKFERKGLRWSISTTGAAYSVWLKAHVVRSGELENGNHDCHYAYASVYIADNSASGFAVDLADFKPRRTDYTKEGVRAAYSKAKELRTQADDLMYEFREVTGGQTRVDFA